MSRVLKTGECRITQSYDEHVKKCNAKQGWARGVDVVKAPALCDYITAHTAGTVMYAGVDNRVAGYGKMVVIKHNSYYVTVYGHMDKVSCVIGQKVATGDIIGYMGSTGNSTGAHLHFEVRKYNRDITFANLHDEKAFTWLDPTPYLNSDILDKLQYRVQVGAFENLTNAKNFAKKMKEEFGDALLYFYEGNYHVQLNSYDVESNARAFLKTVREDHGYKDAFITTKTGTVVAY